MSTKIQIAIGLLIAIAILAYVLLDTEAPVVEQATPQATSSASSQSDEEEIIRQAISEFGAKLNKVTLAGPNNIAAQSIKNNYTAFVTPELLQDWMDDPKSAPGRLVSSPWPDRIEIASLTKNRNGSYTVEGSIIELTSKEVAEGGIANSYPIRLTIINKNGLWYIAEYDKR